MKTKTKLRFADLPKDYAALCRVFLPRPIRDGVDYANVAEVSDAMALWRDDAKSPARLSRIPGARPLEPTASCFGCG